MKYSSTLSQPIYQTLTDLHHRAADHMINCGPFRFVPSSPHSDRPWQTRW
jgi:hypothetical protein